MSGHAFEAQDVLVPFHKRQYPAKASIDEKKDGEPRDGDVEDNTEEEDKGRKGASNGTRGSIVYQRYCHVYQEGELEVLVASLPWCELVGSYYDCGNWAVEVRRIGDPH